MRCCNSYVQVTVLVVCVLIPCLFVNGSLARVRKRQTARPEPVQTTLETPPPVTEVSVQDVTAGPEGTTTTPKPKKSSGTTENPEFQLTATKVPSNWYEAFGQAAAFRLNQTFQSIKTAVFNRIFPKESATARYMDRFMEGAMVPMSFLLMAAFIMDILQRLFPLPYASFVKQAYHRQSVGTASTPTEATTPVQDLNKFEINTPIGNIGLETNDRNKFGFQDWFGRSQGGNPPVVNTATGEPGYDQQQQQPQQLQDPSTTAATEDDEADLDQYLSTLLESQQEQVKSTLANAVTNAIASGALAQYQNQGYGQPGGEGGINFGPAEQQQLLLQQQQQAQVSARSAPVDTSGPVYYGYVPNPMDQTNYLGQYSLQNAGQKTWRRRRKA